MGTRPNFVKAAALWHAARRHPRVRLRLVHTGQHHSATVCAAVLRDLAMPPPDLHLPHTGGSPEQQAESIRRCLRGPLSAWRPDGVIVVGDVTSSVAGARAAHDLGLELAHVEAGLRSFDDTMIEERNRIQIDRLANHFFATEAAAVANLRREGVPAARIHFVGNVMIDMLDRCLPAALARQRWRNFAQAPLEYGVVTLHRPDAVDDPQRLGAILDALAAASRRLPLLFPVHPRTAAALAQWRGSSGKGRLLLLPAQGYLDFLSLLASARFVLTDSGGVQEEATVLGVPCLTLRDNTERPVTVQVGGNELLGLRAERIVPAVDAVLATTRQRPTRPELWDGRAAARVLDVLAANLGTNTNAARGTA